MLPNLKTLWLSDTAVTDVGLKYLKGLANLQSLNLTNTNVTQSGVKELRAAQPNLEILGIDDLRAEFDGSHEMDSDEADGDVETELPGDVDDVPGKEQAIGRIERLIEAGGLTGNCTALSLSSDVDSTLRHIAVVLDLLARSDNAQGAEAGADLKRLRGLTKLQSLRLINSDVTDAGLEHLTGLSNLQ